MIAPLENHIILAITPCMTLYIVTTDVQGVEFTIVGDIYTIQCSYLSGSDVNGCVYVLVSREEGVENVTGFIERDSNGLEVANIGCYSEVLAYDNNTRSLAVKASIIVTSAICPTTIYTGKAITYMVMMISLVPRSSSILP